MLKKEFCFYGVSPGGIEFQLSRLEKEISASTTGEVAASASSSSSSLLLDQVISINDETVWKQILKLVKKKTWESIRCSDFVQEVDYANSTWKNKQDKFMSILEQLNITYPPVKLETKLHISMTDDSEEDVFSDLVCNLLKQVQTDETVVRLDFCNFGQGIDDKVYRSLLELLLATCQTNKADKTNSKDDDDKVVTCNTKTCRRDWQAIRFCMSFDCSAKANNWGPNVNETIKALEAFATSQGMKHTSAAMSCMSPTGSGSASYFINFESPEKECSETTKTADEHAVVVPATPVMVRSIKTATPPTPQTPQTQRAQVQPESDDKSVNNQE